MKRGILFLALLVVFSISGCNGPWPWMIWDIAPFELYVYVEDGEGNDMLNPEHPDSLVYNDISIRFEGETYHMDEVAQTKAYMAMFYGVCLEVDSDGRHYLQIGEFNGDTEYDQAHIILDWGNGSENRLVFSHEFWWKKHEPHHRTYVGLDGSDLVEGNAVTVVMP